jgi:hypothetical protein
VWPVGAVSSTTNPSLPFGHGAGEGPEHSDFLRAGRAQILFQQCPSIRRPALPGSGEHAGTVGFGFAGGVNRAKVQTGICPDGVRHMGGGIGRAEDHRMAALSQRAGDGRGQGGFAHAAFAHGHDHAATLDGDIVLK